MDPSDRRIRRSWLVLGGTFLALGIVAVGRAIGGGTALDWLVALLVVIAAVAASAHAAAVAALDARRRDESTSFTRILSALSRSVSPDAIVDAIVEELGHATGADHIVVVQRRPDANVPEARLVTSRSGVPESTTRLSMADLEDLQRLAARVRDAYGLINVLAAPLEVDGTVIGAIVVSRRSEATWSEASRMTLRSAAEEASASLARAYSHRAAEVSATTDALTGLPNRRYFDEVVSLQARRRRAGDAIGILMVDIDHFKTLNDTHGHAIGDDVLRAVAGAIVAAVREDDVPARFGGEEFVVLLRNPDRGVALDVGERVRTAVRGLDLRRHGVRGVSVSVGVAVALEPDEPVESIIATADRALYRAKRAGRDRVVAA